MATLESALTIGLLFLVQSATFNNVKLLTPDEFTSRNAFRESVDAVIWGGAAVTLDMMPQAYFRDGKATSDDIICWSEGGWKNQLLGVDTSVRCQSQTQVRTVALLLTNKAGSPAKVEEASACPLEKLMQNTGKRLEEFVGNVNRISAIEVLEHERLDRRGKVLEHEKKQFNYVAIIEETSPGALNVDEYRDGAIGATGGFPHDIATVGMPSLAMIFHPYHLDEFEMECEGAAVWREQPVWRVRFQQRKDRPARMSEIRVGNDISHVLLKGTAWIDAGNYQIVHLETELLEPIRKVKLYTERQALDYGPVQFQDSNMSMWLPQEAEIYLDLGGRHFHHRHIYSKYRIFSVEVEQKIESPKQR
jgi:hypothetical protein